MSAYPTIRAVAIGILVTYLLWAIFETHVGNSLVRCGVLTLYLALVMGAALVLKPDFPVWYLGPFLLLLRMLTMFFLVQRTYLVLRNRWRAKKI
jgi:hypothetical protein